MLYTRFPQIRNPDKIRNLDIRSQMILIVRINKILEQTQTKIEGLVFPLKNSRIMNWSFFGVHCYELVFLWGSLTLYDGILSTKHSEFIFFTLGFL